MGEPAFDSKRRGLIGFCLTGALGTPLLGTLRGARAAEKLSPADPAAMKLGYTRASTQANRRCGNCSFFQGKDADWGPCVVFSGKLVAAGGHCMAWAAR